MAILVETSSLRVNREGTCQPVSYEYEDKDPHLVVALAANTSFCLEASVPCSSVFPDSRNEYQDEPPELAMTLAVPTAMSMPSQQLCPAPSLLLNMSIYPVLDMRLRTQTHCWPWPWRPL